MFKKLAELFPSAEKREAQRAHEEQQRLEKERKRDEQREQTKQEWLDANQELLAAILKLKETGHPDGTTLWDLRVICYDHGVNYFNHSTYIDEFVQQEGIEIIVHRHQPKREEPPIDTTKQL